MQLSMAIGRVYTSTGKCRLSYLVISTDLSTLAGPITLLLSGELKSELLVVADRFEQQCVIFWHVAIPTSFLKAAQYTFPQHDPPTRRFRLPYNTSAFRSLSQTSQSMLKRCKDVRNLGLHV